VRTQETMQVRTACDSNAWHPGVFRPKFL